MASSAEARLKLISCFARRGVEQAILIIRKKRPKNEDLKRLPFRAKYKRVKEF